MKVRQQLDDLMASAPVRGDGEPDAFLQPATQWLFAGRGSVASVVSRVLDQDEQLAGMVSEHAGQSWELATDSQGPCQKLWGKLPGIFGKIASEADKGTEPGTILSPGNPLLLELAGAQFESRMERQLTQGEAFSFEGGQVESCRARRPLTEVAQDLSELTGESLLDPMDWFLPESRLHPLSRCAPSPAPLRGRRRAAVVPFPYPSLGDHVSSAVMNRLSNAVDLVPRLVRLCEVKGVRIPKLPDMLSEARALLWDCDGAEDRQCAATVLQLGLLKSGTSPLLSRLPSPPTPEISGAFHLAIQRNPELLGSAVKEAVRALRWTLGLLPRDDKGPEKPPPKKPRRKRGRPEVSPEEAARRKKLVAAWESARETAISRSDFVQDWNEEHPDDTRLTVRALRRAQDWVRQRRNRGQPT